MADEETEAVEQAEPEKKGGIGGKIVNAIGILVLVIAGNIASNIVINDYLPQFSPKVSVGGGEAADGAAKEAAEEEPTGPPIYLALEPALVASIDDEDAIRFVQINVEVMARKQAALNAVMTHTPVIRNNLLMMLGRKDISELTSSEGKEKFRQEALEEVQSVLKKMEPADPDEPLGDIEDLYFTGFMVQ
ncbi:MAG: hypothetical protein HKN56_08375 [Gammaproteobacteria bacterium]|nr:hypothetical protein [Gammaproteobacteria bacterium]